MSFAIVTRGPDGSEYFRGQHQTLRVIHHQVIQPSFTGDIPIPGITPYDTVAYCVSRSAATEYGNLFTEIGNGFVRLSRFNNSHAPRDLLDLTVLRIK
jgi:hypothetical protein